MPKPFPNLKPSNPPMTRGQRRVWLALEQQKRRRGRVSVESASSLTITLAGSVINIFQVGPNQGIALGMQRSADGNFGQTVDGDIAFGATTWDLTGEPAGYYRICFEAEDGTAIAPFSNVVQLLPASSLTITLVGSVIHIVQVGPNQGIALGMQRSDDLAFGQSVDADNAFGATTWDLAGEAAGNYRITFEAQDGSVIAPFSNVVYFAG